MYLIISDKDGNIHQGLLEGHVLSPTWLLPNAAGWNLEHKVHIELF